jgi:large subunit ribosomal protein L21
MYAIIEEGGRQHKVEQGQELQIDYRSIESGEEVRFDRVLAYADDSGTRFGLPLLAGAVVTAEVVGVTQGPKLVVQKLRRRKNSRRRTGHRQMYTKVRISKIEVA